jgi:hypothetical protein
MQEYLLLNTIFDLNYQALKVPFFPKNLVISLMRCTPLVYSFYCPSFARLNRGKIQFKHFPPIMNIPTIFTSIFHTTKATCGLAALRPDKI